MWKQMTTAQEEKGKKNEREKQMSRNVHELIYDISEILDTVEDEYISVIEERDDLQEKLKDLDEKEKEFPKAYDLGFEDGEQSMQEKANKIIEFYRDNNNDIDVLQKVFSRNVIFGDLILEDIKGTYNKIIEYEKKEKEEFRVGDEVMKNEYKYIVFGFYGKDKNTLDLITKHGVMVSLHKSFVKKTGKHYPIEEMLKELEQ